MEPRITVRIDAAREQLFSSSRAQRGQRHLRGDHVLFVRDLDDDALTSLECRYVDFLLSAGECGLGVQHDFYCLTVGHAHKYMGAVTTVSATHLEVKTTDGNMLNGSNTSTVTFLKA